MSALSQKRTWPDDARGEALHLGSQRKSWCDARGYDANYRVNAEADSEVILTGLLGGDGGWIASIAAAIRSQVLLASSSCLFAPQSAAARASVAACGPKFLIMPSAEAAILGGGSFMSTARTTAETRLME